MNDMTIGGFDRDDQPQTMSSLEVAQLTGKRHDNVMADIRKMIVEMEGEGGLLKFQDTHANQQNGQSYPIFRLPKRETLILVSGYNLKMRAAIIDRWQDLEAAALQPAVLSRMDLIKLALDAETELQHEREKVARLEHKVDETAPKADFYDRFADADGLYGLQNAGRVLHQPPNKFVRWLKQDYLFYQGGSLVPRAPYVKSGLFEVKSELVDEKPRSRTWMTPKGVQYFAKKLGVETPTAH